MYIVGCTITAALNLSIGNVGLAAVLVSLALERILSDRLEGGAL
jgi:hypothetical protein